MLTIGLTGGIGSGKSTLGKLLEARGATRLDADAICRSLTAPGGAAIGAIAREFGPQAIAADGSMDRAAMRRLVFAHPENRQRLEAILHPATLRALQALRQGATGAYVVEEIPLLLEVRFAAPLDRILVVDVPRAEQIRRVMARSGLARGQVESILAAQCSREQRLAAADDVVCNWGTLADLERAAARLDALYRALC